MKKLLPQIGLLFLLLLPLLGWAQEIRISGRVVDAEINTPIRFASVMMKLEGIGVIADERGEFQLVSSGKYKQDSLIVESGEFQFERTEIVKNRTAMLVQVSNSNGLLVMMQKQKKLITTNQSGRRRKKGVTNKSVEAWASLSKKTIVGLPGNEYAFLIKNESHKLLGNIRTVSFYIESNCCFPRELFCVHIYKSNGDSPASVSLNEREFLWVPNGRHWGTVDLSKYKIAVPEGDYFVSLEFAVDYGRLDLYTQSTLDNYVQSGHLMYPYFDPKKSSVWKFVYGKGWELLPLDNTLLGRYGAMIKVEVEPLK